MKICAIVAEYNPFHNGHKYQIEKAKEITGCDSVIAIMSGNFVQRGSPSIFNKWDRANLAISNGLDLVFELPTIYSTASAEYFATGSISILNKLNNIDYICFGTENDDIDLLTNLAKILIKEPEKYKDVLTKELKKGVNYPKARSTALISYLKKEYDSEMLEEVLLSPNNILAIEYIKALIKSKSKIKPVAIKRLNAPYNSDEINNDMASSHAIRNLLDQNNISTIQKICPSSTLKMIAKNLSNGITQMKLNNFEKEILLKLRTLDNTELKETLDVSDNIDHVLYKAIANCNTIDELIDMMKSKRYTQARIQRILIHVLLGIKTQYLEKNKNNPQYARVLAFSEKGRKIISKISKNTEIPIVISVASFMKKCTDKQKEMLEKDILATNIYMLGYEIPKHRFFNLDYTKRLNE